MSSYELQASTQYGLVVRATAGDSSNKILWRVDYATPTYSGGTKVGSTNSGSSWGSQAEENMFEIWGTIA